MTKKYSVANFVLEIRSDTDTEFEQRLFSYMADTSEKSDIFINVSKTSQDIDVKKNDIKKINDISYFYSQSNSDVFFCYDKKIGKTISKIEFSKDYKNIDITLYELNKNHGVSDKMLMFNMIGIAMDYSMQFHQGFVFHSSSICYSGQGISFSAPSGTGKSTHTSLWLNNIPDTFILNDDTPIITLGQDNVFYLCGTPWAGTSGINKNSIAPLKAIVFLRRSKENFISELGRAQAMPLLFEGIRQPLTDEMLFSTLSTLNKLIDKVPIYMLNCNMDPSAAFLVKEKLFGDR